MNVALWVLQLVLALVFAMASLMKLRRQRRALPAIRNSGVGTLRPLLVLNVPPAWLNLCH